MNIETAQKVSDLLKQKVEFEKDLVQLLSQDYSFILGTDAKRSYTPYTFELKISKKSSFNARVKNMVVSELKQEISKLEDEINNLGCL